jgi:hypothetical protein
LPARGARASAHNGADTYPVFLRGCATWANGALTRDV